METWNSWSRRSRTSFSWTIHMHQHSVEGAFESNLQDSAAVVNVLQSILATVFILCHGAVDDNDDYDNIKGGWLSFHRKGKGFSRLEQSSRFRSKVLKLLEFYNSHDQVFLATPAVWMCHGHGMSLWWDQPTAWFAARDVHTWSLYIYISYIFVNMIFGWSMVI